MISFFAAELEGRPPEFELGDEAAAHARARRIAPGEDARVLNGRGTIANGRITAVEKKRVVIALERFEDRPRPHGLTLLVPVADKDRMLMAAEKCAELQVTAWRPVVYERSRSVSPRGEGDRFRERVVARMQAALEQSGGAWLPAVEAETSFIEALGASASSDRRVLLDAGGRSLMPLVHEGTMALAIGPEGGFTGSERGLAAGEGWQTVSLGRTVLRFETAIIVAAGTVRAAQVEV